MPHFHPFARLRLSLRRMSLAHCLTMLITLVCIGLITSTAVLGWNSRTEWLKNAAAATENVAYSVAQHADASFSQTDTVLLDVVERLEEDGIDDAALTRLKAVFARKVDEQSQLHGLFVYDETGRWLVHSQPVAPAGANNADREYFQYHRTHTSRGPHIGAPIRSKSTSDWIIPMSRRLDGPDGRFAGVVLATIKVADFDIYHRQFSIGTDGLIAMNLMSGELVARRPVASELIGANLANTAFFQSYLGRYSKGTVTLASPLDGIERQYAFRRLDKYPVVILAAIPVHDTLAGWRTRMIVQSSVILGLIGLITLGGYFLVRQVNLQTIAKKKLKESFAKVQNLEQALDEHAIMGITDTEHKLIYVNDRFCKVSKYPRAELLGQDPGIVASGFHSNAFLMNIRTTIASGEVWKGETKNRAKDGSFYWTSSTIVPFLDEEGKPYQYVAIRTDITDQKNAEEQLVHAKTILQQSNLHLTMLSTQDGLTGLANRRHFDQALKRETARMANADMPLALLMIDIDYFKTYNDRYGHPAGDDCLRKVAVALADHAKRPGDLVARYGGEEFAILLPCTDQAGARVIAEEIRTGLASLELAHPDNPAGIVTASVGLHAVVPGLDHRTGGILLDQADLALYAAKAAGRNIVCSSLKDTRPEQ
jgi:diguanylate cyclase (GGDEF)-like protein/PAS domain S-box-containing protein